MAGGDSVAGEETLQARIAALETELEQTQADTHARLFDVEVAHT